jgi:hypothetical protein
VNECALLSLTYYKKYLMKIIHGKNRWNILEYYSYLWKWGLLSISSFKNVNIYLLLLCDLQCTINPT